MCSSLIIRGRKSTPRALRTLSSLVALIIALLTVSYQTFKAATTNPVDSSRYE